MLSQHHTDTNFTVAHFQLQKQIPNVISASHGYQFYCCSFPIAKANTQCYLSITRIPILLLLISNCKSKYPMLSQHHTDTNFTFAHFQLQKQIPNVISASHGYQFYFCSFPIAKANTQCYLSIT